MAECKMDPTLKAEWLRRLRSGDYQQGAGRLRDAADHFCCIGVLIDAKDPDGWVEYGSGGYSYEDENGTLDATTAEGVYGLTEEMQTRLIQMNDGETEENILPQDFAHIADYIEEHVA